MDIDQAVEIFSSRYNVRREIDKQILQLVMDGKSYEEISEILFYEPTYIRERVTKLARKAKLHSRYRIMAAIYSIEKGEKSENQGTP